LNNNTRLRFWVVKMARDFYTMTWLKNIRKYDIKSNLTLTEAQRISDKNKRLGRKTKILKRVRK